MPGLTSTDRAISPVIGVVLIVAIVVALAVVAGGLVLGLTEEREPAPDVTLSLAAGDDIQGEFQLVHDHGDTLDGERVQLRGVADADGMADRDLTAAERHRVFATDESIAVVWFGDDDTSYVLREFSVDPTDTVPAPDEGCDWVDSETNGGTDQAKVDGLVVGCDIETDDKVEVFNDGVVIGDVTSRARLLDADDGRVYGDVTVEKDFNVQDTTVGGSVTAQTEVGKVDDSTVSGSAEAEKTVEVINGGSVGGDVESATKDAKVLDSSVGGSVRAAGQVKLDNATVGGDVYVDASDFDCTDSTIAGQDCGEYSPKDPDA